MWMGVGRRAGICLLSLFIGTHVCMQENLSRLHLPVNGNSSNARGFCTCSGKKEGVLPVFNTCSMHCKFITTNLYFWFEFRSKYHRKKQLS